MNDSDSWVPCSALDSYEGVVWLPRMLQKARRFALGRARGTNLMSDYMFGNNDAIDRVLLDFLKVNDERVVAIIEVEPEDAEAARVLVAESGRTQAERQAFNAEIKRKFFNFSMIEADEGRMRPGLRAAILKFAYNRILMPKFAADFRRAEERRSG